MLSSCMFSPLHQCLIVLYTKEAPLPTPTYPVTVASPCIWSAGCQCGLASKTAANEPLTGTTSPEIQLLKLILLSKTTRAIAGEKVGSQFPKGL